MIYSYYKHAVFITDVASTDNAQFEASLASNFKDMLIPSDTCPLCLKLTHGGEIASARLWSPARLFDVQNYLIDFINYNWYVFLLLEEVVQL
jgi:hypothetical protein